MDKSELAEECKKLGLPEKGTKRTLLKRIKEFLKKPVETAEQTQ